MMLSTTVPIPIGASSDLAYGTKNMLSRQSYLEEHLSGKQKL